jgi:hypothetical protein
LAFGGRLQEFWWAFQNGSKKLGAEMWMVGLFAAIVITFLRYTDLRHQVA